MNETSTTSIPEDDDEDEGGERGGKQPIGHMNSDGAWCWREGCLGGLLFLSHIIIAGILMISLVYI